MQAKGNSVVIYHNPNCGTSRNVLGLIRNTGIEPTIILYLETPLNRDEIQALLNHSGLTARQALRNNVEEYTRLNLESDHWAQDELITFMAQHPILLNRPFVVTNKGTKLCRPSETVLEILEAPQLDEFYKEDGEKVI
ncbi:arsenate reductase (glutaredoxin) [Wohlfahrtiimonas chitiniclastica]|uniref:arsenate reductase (glutaredoxin) n=1 Tax=Wohlfahrtiimonas chitiniclastica TaxID=400946 RepID=UPI000B997122|nr:arsenate reductase (glutaredoxin) [Wohlfahrtiimonas chitiniclastica]MBS7815691.1 arsenate reductase (glutaredoxin) [Wohlfahrtiimonas chitiniclastica]MBS7821582.1 arsenate reductase (glutaredoxin) [Wohlfahrtiimonas chitiniclastica]MBS7829361.1 arsenate reductase (glutaredoxin) [Wohlfahrtiimonas chitiniclastica]OYQ82375.1 arsenate reductase (glutaredoxin) [Wohlfahrtiimonas chitiniclastica]OYQ83409.1 arsenate reductase (glutaredoxin) [Wohlfahrtiimonas chitiniclastica]